MLMTKEKILKYIKIALFWLVYAVFMVFNLSIIGYLISELFFEIFDPEYWRENYTLYPYVEVEIPTTLGHKLNDLFIIVLFTFSIVWGNYRLYKKKKGVLWILAIFVYYMIVSFIYYELIKGGYPGMPG